MALPTRSKAPSKPAPSTGPDQPVAKLGHVGYGLQQLELDSMLKTMIRAGEDVSDLLFVVGQAPHLRDNGVLRPVETDPPGSGLTADHIEEMFLTMTAGDSRLLAEYQKNGTCDFVYDIRSAHFRANYFRRNGLPAMVLRRLPAQVPTLASLGLPDLLRQVTGEKHGLILVTAPPGHGKSTTLAAILHQINQTNCVHVVTLEDPIRYFHADGKSIISQRELGKDFNDYPSGLRAALRQAPDVIEIGEIRDRDTLEMALLAAEKGHLILASLPTANAAQTILRLTSFFDRQEDSRIRQRLANSLRWIFSQRLIAKTGGGHHLIMETLGTSQQTRDAILEGSSDQRRFTDSISSSQSLGWVTYDQQILAACKAGWITEETSQLYLTQKPRVAQTGDYVKRETHFSNPSDLSSGLRLNADSARVTRIIR